MSYYRVPAWATPDDEYEEDVDGLANRLCPLCKEKFILGKRCFHFGLLDPRCPPARVSHPYICHRCMKKSENRPLAEIMGKGANHDSH
jgi:hypothetical protein